VFLIYSVHTKTFFVFVPYIRAATTEIQNTCVVLLVDMCLPLFLVRYWISALVFIAQTIFAVL
jgi:hypothetical protein